MEFHHTIDQAYLELQESFYKSKKFKSINYKPDSLKKSIIKYLTFKADIGNLDVSACKI